MSPQAILIRRRAELTRVDRGQLSATESPAEPLERSTLLQLRDLAADLADRSKAALVAVDEAIARANRGTYGCCEDCGEAIPSKRRAILPEAACCAPCQAAREAR